MAKNLQAKLPSSDTLRIYDINTESLKKFANDTKSLSSGATVEIAATIREAAEHSVSSPESYCSIIFAPLFFALYVMSLFYQ